MRKRLPTFSDISTVTTGKSLDAYVQQQNEKVKEILKKRNNICNIEKEVQWFFQDLGIDDFYFYSQTPEQIAEHIETIYAGRLLHKDESSFKLSNDNENDALYVVSDEACKTGSCRDTEIQIEKKYLDVKLDENGLKPYRMSVYRTRGTISAESTLHLRFYFIRRCEFANNKVNEDETDINKIGELTFLKFMRSHTRDIFNEMIPLVKSHMGPIVKIYDAPTGQLTTDEEVYTKRMFIGFHSDSTHSLFSTCSAIFRAGGFYSTKKYVEQFSNKTSFFVLFLRDKLNRDKNAVNVALEKISADIKLLFVLPRTALTKFLLAGDMDAEEVSFAYCAWKFAHQFVNRYMEEYNQVKRAVDKYGDETTSKNIEALKRYIRRDTFTETRVCTSIENHPDVIKKIYTAFKKRHHPDLAKPDYNIPEYNDLVTIVKRSVDSEIDKVVFYSIINFIKHIKKTNFYHVQPLSFGFRLDPNFLKEVGEYPDLPFAVFMFIGNYFRGFHIRFRDISRGGLRLIRSRNQTRYALNVDSLFEENYNLAHTQQRKNKDIPEGGSKGTILLHLEHQDKEIPSFKYYIDALLDLTLPDKARIVDHYGKEEIIFCGPDEGTADKMLWACEYAKKRGNKFWKAFTTGKPQSIGGIPHDDFGMTTRSVHANVLGALKVLGKDETKVRKFQTGGPDGDLGSNEVTISKDKTTAIVDGSGVLYDPDGIDRKELEKLVAKRAMVNQFDTKKLTKNGFFISVEDKDKKLPDGTVVYSGLSFRDEFHLNPLSSADLFVPCGGRPKSVDLHNIDKMFDSNGKPRFPIIIEGANLFFTQPARLVLEKAGVFNIKDATANKGGVTSSSFEVYASLALDEEQFKKHMMVKGKEKPKFYSEYVAAIQNMIQENSTNEFQCICNEYNRKKKPRCVIADETSNKINSVGEGLAKSPLWDDVELRKIVITKHTPKPLLDLVGLDTIMKRVPEEYLKAIFAAWLASQYVYKYGMDPSEFAFFQFIDSVKLSK